MPNVRVHNSKPSVGIRNTVPNIRASSANTGRAGDSNIIYAGSPIGLLLALTYANTFHSLPTYGDLRPHVRIRNI